MPGPLEDVPPVQAGLAWLQSRADDSRWLVVLDNMGPFSTDLSGIALKGSAGTVLVTGQDARAWEPLGESILMVEVGAMEPDEALELLRRRLGVSSLFENSSLELAQELTSSFERSAFAMDLASARIAVDMDKSENISSALRRYLADYQAVRDKRSDDVEELFVAASTFEIAMSMALEVTMSSLKNLDDELSVNSAIQLLDFLTFLNPTNIQDELFRPACRALGYANIWLETSPSSWIQSLLSARAEDRREWDDAAYRDIIDTLQHYGLVKPTYGPWKGITMHRLVHQRASQGRESAAGWKWYLMFLIATCNRQPSDGHEGFPFRQHLILHFPAPGELQRIEGHFPAATQIVTLLDTLSEELKEAGRIKDHAELEVRNAEAGMTLFPQNPKMAVLLWDPMLGNAEDFCKWAFWEQARTICQYCIQLCEETMFPDPDVWILEFKHRSAILHVLSTWSLRFEEDGTLLAARREVLGVEHPETLGNMISSVFTDLLNMEDKRKAQSDIIEILSIAQDEKDPDVLMALDDLVELLRETGRLEEADKVGSRLIETSVRTAGE